MGLTRKNIRPYPTSLVRILFEIDQQITERHHSGVSESFEHEMRISGEHLSGQIGDLSGIAHVLEEHQIVSVKTYGSAMFALVE
jgi:hypothetical protein